MYILVLGAGGFIGSHLIEKLISNGHIVYGVDLKYSEFRNSSATKFIIGDLRDLQFVKSIFAMQKYDRVYQLAANMGGATYINCGDHDADVMSDSVTININIAKCCVEFKTKRLFFSSSACVYSRGTTNSANCKEEDAYPSHPDNEYGWEKLFSERMYKSFEKQYGLEIRIARFHSIVGEYSTWTGGKEKAHSALIRKVIMNNEVIEVIGNGNQVRTFLHVSDCIQGIIELMESNCKEIVNIGSDETITINEYIEMLLKISGKKLSIKYVDGPTGIQTRLCDLTKVKNCIRWKPSVSLEEATRKTYNWIYSEINKNILFVSQKVGYEDQKYHCGIGIKGKLITEILHKSSKYNFISCFIDNNTDLEKYIIDYKPKAIFYNYHETTTPWLNDPFLRIKYSNVHHVLIHYDIHQKLVDAFKPFNQFKYLLTDDDTLVGNDNVFVVPRSIPIDNFSSKYIHSIPKIGFQGFAIQHKNIPLIARTVNNEFDEAILRLHIPFSYYGTRENIQHILDDVYKQITKPCIKIEVSHDFLTDEEIVKWLSENTVNCYFNDYLDGAGIASSPDYAISARRPIAITKSHQFRNMWNLSPSIIIGENTLKQIIENGTKPLEPLYEKYSHKNLISAYEKICDGFY